MMTAATRLPADFVDPYAAGNAAVINMPDRVVIITEPRVAVWTDPGPDWNAPLDHVVITEPNGPSDG